MLDQGKMQYIYDFTLLLFETVIDVRDRVEI
jgi:hypothetical protein